MGAYTNAGQQRIIKAMLVLFGDVVNGLPPGALVKALGASAAAITRDMANLIEAGIAERIEETGHYRLTPRLPQQAIKVFTAIDASERRVQEAKQRFTRKPD
ncbi:MAG: hypothetical protein WC091_01295 [Sulfuricellaceae bacterium]